MPPQLVRVDEVAAVPWRNGGGVTRELLAWPDPRDWPLRVSVAKTASGPFSTFAGVDRWFAVLAGDGVWAETVGHVALELTPADSTLHAFPGDAPTCCTLGPGLATRDLNLMARRGQARLRACPLRDSPLLSTSASGAGLFVAGPTMVTTEGNSTTELPAMSLAWWANPERAPLTLRASKAPARGWWFEIEA